MKQLRLDPITCINGEINIPGSKSISNRALLLATLAKGTTTLTNLLDSDDIRYMLASLKQLGIQYSLNDDKTVCVVEGNGGPLVCTKLIFRQRRYCNASIVCRAHLR